MRRANFSIFFNQFILSSALIFVLSVCPAAFAGAQISFQHLNEENGLSQSNVYSIIQDDDGFLWFATQNGINKYDGYEMSYYRSELGDPNSIPHNIIRTLFKDSKGRIWVGTAGGLAKYNPESDNFTTYVHEPHNPQTLSDNTIWAIHEDYLHNIWITTEQGVHRYLDYDNSFEHIVLEGDGDDIREIKSIFRASNGFVWLGTYEQGLYLLNRNQRIATSLRKENKWDIQIDAEQINDITEINGVVWVATNQGIYQIETTVTEREGKPTLYQFSLKNDAALDQIIQSKSIRSMATVTESNKVFIGSIEGLIIVDLDTYAHTTHQSDPMSSASLSSDLIYVIFPDKNQNIWLGTDFGLNKFSIDSLNFKHFYRTGNQSGQLSSNLIEAVTQLKDDVWLASAGNFLDKFNIQTEQFENHPLGFSEKVWGLGVTANTAVWLTSEDALYEYTPANRSLNKHTNITDQYRLAGPIIAKDNTLFLGTLDAELLQLDAITKQIDKLDISNCGVAPTDSISPLRLENQTLWLAVGSTRICRYNLVEQTARPFEIDSIVETDFGWITDLVTHNQQIYVSTLSAGVYVFAVSTGKLINHYAAASGIANGIANNSITNMNVDNDDNIWVSTSFGLSRINTQTNAITNFYQKDGLQANEFNENASIKVADGRILVAGKNGFNLFNPSDIASEQRNNISAPVLTNLLLKNKPASEVSDRILSTDFNLTRSFELDYHISPITFEFTSPNAKYPERVGYRYRLARESNWIETSYKNRRATYTNLNSGKYQFIVQAYDATSGKHFQTKSIEMVIKPAPWLSGFALAIYAIMIIALCMWLYSQYQRKRAIRAHIRASEERLKLALWGSGDEMWDWNIETGKIFRSNIWGVLEFPQDGKRNLGGKQTNIHQQDLERVRDALNSHFEKETDHFEATYRVQDKNGNWVWVLDRGKIVESDLEGAPTRMTGTLKDISKIKVAEERLRLFAKSFENISDAIAIYDSEFKIIETNPSFTRITGLSRENAIGKPLGFNLYQASYSAQVKRTLLQNGTWFGELDEKRVNGELYHTEMTIDKIHDSENDSCHYVAVFSDITERKATEAELRKLSNTDTLTNLPNRSYFQAIQGTLVQRNAQHALLVFDLDNFKKINDSLGHQLGDLLLCMVADRLRLLGRSQDSIYRLGGDEFALIMEETNDIHTITSTAKNILRRVNEPFRLKNHEIVVSSSIGIVLFPEDGRSPQELLKNADTAMYHAKNLGGNCYQFFSDSMNKKAVKRLQIENLIRHGLKEDFFSVYYQPKIDLATGRITGMEALVRFITPKKGLISPGAFIPIAEETGQIIDIGEVVLRKAFFDTKSWIDKGLFNGRIAVNLSARQFDLEDLGERIDKTLELTDLPARYIELEITEGTVMDHPQKAIATMHKLRKKGMHLALDDFGTGYSSLAYLKQFPLNTLKIDKVFVDDIEDSDKGRNMVSTIITIARNLDMSVVAEGVETVPQFEYLRSVDCDQMQGYLYSKPVSSEEFERLLIKEKREMQKDTHQTFNGQPVF